MTAQLANETKTKSTRQTKKSNLEKKFFDRWLEYYPHETPPIAQVHLDFEFNGRFDFAWIDSLVALEVQGGTWNGGAHVRGSGYRDDCMKINLALLKGWRVFQATTDMLRPDKSTGRILVIDQIVEANKQKANSETQWISWIRLLQAGETIEKHGFEIERMNATKYRVNDRVIQERTTRMTWMAMLDTIMYYPLSLDEIFLLKHAPKVQTKR